MSSLFLLTNISMPNKWPYRRYFSAEFHTEEMPALILLAAKNQKNIILFSFWRRLLTYSTILLQWIRSIFKIVCDCVWLYTYLLTYYLKVLTYFWFLFSFFVFSLFLFSFFFVKNQIQTTFFCKKILRTFLPPPNNVMLCFFLFLKTSESRKKGQQVKKNKTSNQQPNQ